MTKIGVTAYHFQLLPHLIDEIRALYPDVKFRERQANFSEDELIEFLDELDRMVIDCGGRLYLAKDARMKPDVFRAGYPRADEFIAAVRTWNPEFKLRSLLAERLVDAGWRVRIPRGRGSGCARQPHGQASRCDDARGPGLAARRRLRPL